MTCRRFQCSHGRHQCIDHGFVAQAGLAALLNRFDANSEHDGQLINASRAAGVEFLGRTEKKRAVEWSGRPADAADECHGNGTEEDADLLTILHFFNARPHFAHAVLHVYAMIAIADCCV